MDARANLSGDAGFLWDFWYPALRSGELPHRELVPARLLGLPLVLGRDTGPEGRARPFALRDNCPHRGMPLSRGKFDGCNVECIYHGWKFDARTGQCREIPALTADAKIKVDRISARSFSCEERDGYVWVFLPDPNNALNRARRAASDIPPVPSLPVFSERYRTFFHSVSLPVGVDQGMMGLLDPAHGPYVHESWFWRSRHAQREKQKTFEPIPNGFRMTAHPPSANSAIYKLLGVYNRPVTTTIDFVLPNLRLETVCCGPHWFTNRTMVTPIDAHHCRMDFSAAWNIFLHVPLVGPIFGIMARRFIGQDRRNFELQAAGLASAPQMMLLGDADQQARWYLSLKAAWRESRETGAPLRHPLTEPATLRWRS
jgi:phenylpropionate dioxygenase-like ring-hydroxylating dioxygenase large terminal subunit